MKPKNRIYCLDALRSKMLFDTEKEANTFIKFNWQELTDDPEKLRAYYCSTCGGYHITSHAYNPNYGWRTRLALSQYDETKRYKSIAHINDISYLKKLLQSHNNILYFQKPKFKVKIRKIEYDPQTDEIIVTYGDYYDSKKDKIENVLNVQNGQVKMLLDSLKRELSKNENIIINQDNKKLYEMKNQELKIIKVEPLNNMLNENWAATAGFSTMNDYNISGFSYEIKPLSFTLCQAGNDPRPDNNNKSFKHFIGDHVTGYSPYDNKKHEGMIKYIYWGPDSDGTMPMYVYIQDFANEDTIPLEAKTVKQTLTRYTSNDLALKDYFRARDTEIAHDFASTESPKIYEHFDFNSNGKTLNELYAYLNEERVMSKKFFDENFKIKTRPGFHYKEYVDKTTGAYVTSVPSDDKPTGTMKFFAKHGISKVYNGSIGFSEKEQKWYGWSHRAIYGFGIGSKVKKGDCGYKGKTWTAKTLDDAKQMAKDFADGVS